MLLDHVMSTFKRTDATADELKATTKAVEEGTPGAPAHLEAAVEEHELAWALHSSTAINYLCFE